jgi:hypothetical protein
MIGRDGSRIDGRALSGEELMTTSMGLLTEISSRSGAAWLLARAGAIRTLGMLLLLTPCAQGLAQAPPAGGSPASGVGTTFTSDGKLFSPLPPPPADAPAPNPDPHDLEGVWVAPPPFPAPQEEPKLTPQALEKQQRLMKRQAEGKPAVTNAGRCRPMDNETIGWDLFPAQIIQSPHEIVVLEEEGRGRWIIYLDRGHPAHLKPSYWGDSIGHWEGDTLVVDTTGFSGEQDDTTSETHRVARIRKADGGRQLQMTLIASDPNMYLEPHTSRYVSNWHPELQLLEFQCEENPTGALEGLTSQ